MTATRVTRALAYAWVVLLSALVLGPLVLAAIYRELVPAMRRGDHVEAAPLHTLGAAALTAIDDSDAASAARNAEAAWAARREHLPPALRTSFETGVRGAFPPAPGKEPPHG